MFIKLLKKTELLEPKLVINLDNIFTIFMASYPSGLRDQFAKLSFAGSNPADASQICPGGGIGRHYGLKIHCP
jgi:hypothetical protein